MTTPTPSLLLAYADPSPYFPIFVMILAAIGFAVLNIVGSFILGPKRLGDRKGETYESGMTPVGTARKRFNVRFYLIAMVFLVFDVEVVFLYPWAATYTLLDPQSDQSLVWLGRILFFLLTTVVAYLYGYRKGVFKFD